MTTHCAVFDAAHAQSRAALTVSVPAAPAAGTISMELVTVTPQRVTDGAVSDVFEEVHEAVAASSRMGRSQRARANSSAVERELRTGCALIRSIAA